MYKEYCSYWTFPGIELKLKVKIFLIQNCAKATIKRKNLEMQWLEWAQLQVFLKIISIDCIQTKIRVHQDFERYSTKLFENFSNMGNSQNYE